MTVRRSARPLPTRASLALLLAALAVLSLGACRVPLGSGGEQAVGRLVQTWSQSTDDSLPLQEIAPVAVVGVLDTQAELDRLDAQVGGLPPRCRGSTSTVSSSSSAATTAARPRRC